MRIFLAGASGVIGQRLIPRLVQAGHVVGGLTRSPSKTELLSHLGVCVGIVRIPEFSGFRKIVIFGLAASLRLVTSLSALSRFSCSAFHTQYGLDASRASITTANVQTGICHISLSG
jgi:hypothetical protein